MNGKLMKKQSGQQLANLLCAATEWENSERIVANGDLLEQVRTKAGGLKHVYRVVDDRIAPKDAIEFLPTAEQYGLELSEYEEGSTVTFAGYRVESTLSSCTTDLADKQEKISFLITRYPHANSNVPNTTIIGSIVGLFVNLRRGTQDETKLKDDIYHYVSNLKCFRGYPYA